MEKGKKIKKEKVIFWLVVVSKVSDVHGCGWYVVRVTIYVVSAALGVVIVVVLHFSCAIGGRSEGHSTGCTTAIENQSFVRGLYQKLPEATIN
jgi:hypothetical protein